MHAPLEREDQRDILTSQLAGLLGFADGASDVLEHLLSIESRADLLDYLVQLLGSDRQDQLVSFVDNVERYQQGETIPSKGASTEVRETAPIAPAKPALVTLTSKKAPVSRVNNTKRPPPPSETKPPPPKSAVPSPTVPVSTKATNVNPTPARASNRNKKKVAAEQQIKRPSQGQASIECGCFGRLHPALTNCLRCGRISCAREGYDYCPFCGFLVQEVGNDAVVNDEAWLHKEKLLQFDREFAQRTVVVDDQVDYYSNAKSIWLTDQEREEATRQDKQRNDEMHLRQKMQLNLSL